MSIEGAKSNSLKEAKKRTKGREWESERGRRPRSFAYLMTRGRASWEECRGRACDMRGRATWEQNGRRDKHQNATKSIQRDLIWTSTENSQQQLFLGSSSMRAIAHQMQKKESLQMVFHIETSWQRNQVASLSQPYQEVDKSHCSFQQQTSPCLTMPMHLAATISTKHHQPSVQSSLSSGIAPVPVKRGYTYTKTTNIKAVFFGLWTSPAKPFHPTLLETPERTQRRRHPENITTILWKHCAQFGSNQCFWNTPY
ncbi:hypothetical protein IEQ34_018505 [Dendrobium chrysotoxum]|uniref:Uncharacterized protein n=1 Tax=Dendrobium chrysotoxum TaxID=161865 RepID=A0AAV7G4R6_DENCH|nr:hypothetical protein IEQ34_018505 [Dendrobium chrysotoxum]